MTIKKQEVVSKGIVLQSRPYKESDALVTIYFEDYGKMTLIAKGVKKLKSKNAPALQSLTYSEVTFIPRSGLSFLIKATALDYYRYIKEDIVLEAFGNYFMEYVLKNEEDNVPSLDAFHYLKISLDDLNAGYDPKLIYLLYNAFILKRNGTPLQVDGCVRCNKKDHIKAISLEDGGFVCLSCMNIHDMELDKRSLKAFRHINIINIDDIDKIKVDEDVLDRLMEIMDIYVDEHTGIVFRSKKFITKLIKL